MTARFGRLSHGAALGALLVTLSACGSDGGIGSSPTPTPAPTPTPTASPATVSITPATTTLSTADTLAVGIAVTGATDGTVTLTSGGYTSPTAAVSGGRASITLPAGVLAVGSDTVAARFQPSATGSVAATGSATVTVAAAAAPKVTAPVVASLPTNGHPFSALPVDGALVVSVSANTVDPSSKTGLRVFSGSAPAQLAFKCFQEIAYPNTKGISSAFGLAATANNGLALAIEDAGLALINRTATTGACSGTPVQISQGTLASGQGTFDVAVTPDGQYAFVANEYGVANGAASGIPGNVGVVQLAYGSAGAPMLGPRGIVGQIATKGSTIAGVMLSPDGKRLYVTSEVAPTGAAVSGTGNTVLAHNGCTQQPGAATTNYGLLTVIDVAKAEASADSSAIIATVAAGCSPVRSAESADGEVLWVAARGDNRVLAFSTRSLEANPDNALLGYADTGGIAPVGLALFAGGRLLAVANSNRFDPTATGSLAILQAVPVRPTVLQTVTGKSYFFPRSINVAADGMTLFLTLFNGGSVDVIAPSIQ